MRFRHLSGASAILACGALIAALLTGRSAEIAPRTLTAPSALNQAPAGWETAAPRDEIRPAFSFDPTGGPKKDGAFVITHDDREGLHGWFQKSFPVAGGKHYRFHAVRKVDERRGAAAQRRRPHPVAGRQAGKPVPTERAARQGIPRRLRRRGRGRASRPTRTPTPAAGPKSSDTYQAPAKATRAIVELHLHWAPGGEGRVERMCRSTRAAGARAAQGAAGDRPLPAVGQVACRQLRGVRPADRRGRASRRPTSSCWARRSPTTASARATPSAPSRSPARRRSTSASWPRSTTCTSSPACSSATGTSSTTSRC